MDDLGFFHFSDSPLAKAGRTGLGASSQSGGDGGVASLLHALTI